MDKIKMTFMLLVSFCYSSIVLCQKQAFNDKTNEVTTFVENTMKELEIPGVAVAVIKNNETVYKNYLGKSNLEYNTPITKSSLFRLHSLSKIFVSVGIFQLIEQNKITLDDTVAMHLPDVPDAWKNIQIKHLLSHASGLPDMRDETSLSEEIAQKNIYRQDILFPFGERANYNQTNFWLLNRIIRKITNGSFQDHITRQFQKDAEVCFSNVLNIVPKRVMEYKPNANGQLKNFHFVVPEYLYGAGGITMRLDDLIDWNQRLNSNVLLSAAFKQKMLTPFQYKVGTGFSYGWDIQQLNGITSYGFNGGGLVNYRIFPSKGITIIWFTNGYRKPYNVDRITNKIAGFFDKDLIDATPEFANALAKIVGNTTENLASAYRNLKKKYPYVHYEKVINGMGYHFLTKKNIKAAILLFKLNTEEFPTSANTFDSLAEGYYLNKQFELSKKNYKKSLKLNPSNTNAAQMIEKINKEHQ